MTDEYDDELQTRSQGQKPEKQLADEDRAIIRRIG
jgi:hypothetical protein